jgi:hypothetical protein
VQVSLPRLGKEVAAQLHQVLQFQTPPLVLLVMPQSLELAMIQPMLLGSVK